MTGRIRVLVADDEALARNGLSALLTSDPDIEVVGTCVDGAQTVKAIRELHPDIVFLDVQMPVVDGFGVLREIESEDVPTIVFVTAYDRYALKAFDVHAIDYLLKPFEDERFQLALDRAKAQVHLIRKPERTEGEALVALSTRLARFLDAAESAGGKPALPQGEPARHPARLVVRSNGRIRFVRVSDLLWIEAADYYVKLHVGGKTHMLRESMTSLEQRLDPSLFFRVHRSAIVNLDHVREVQPYARGEFVVILNDNTQLRLAQTRRDELALRLGERL